MLQARCVTFPRVPGSNRQEAKEGTVYGVSLSGSNAILYNMAEGYISAGTGSMDTDLEQVRAFKGGDQSAFVELIGKYKDRVYRHVYSIVQDRHEADDVAQEVFLKVYFKIGSFQENSSFFTWLYSITVNECRHALRKRKRPLLSLDAPVADDESARLGDLINSGEKDPESQLVSEEQARLMRELIDTLPEKYRTIYVLRNIDGLSYREIADVMGISAEKVKVWLFRAREKMDEKLRPLGAR